MLKSCLKSRLSFEALMPNFSARPSMVIFWLKILSSRFLILSKFSQSVTPVGPSVIVPNEIVENGYRTNRYRSVL